MHSFGILLPPLAAVVQAELPRASAPGQVPWLTMYSAATLPASLTPTFSTRWSGTIF